MLKIHFRSATALMAKTGNKATTLTKEDITLAVHQKHLQMNRFKL